jgi:hypothetical protein
VLTLLERIGGIAPNEIHGKLINRLSNIITMDAAHHACFDRLDWWMEPVPSGVRTVAYVDPPIHTQISALA